MNIHIPFDYTEYVKNYTSINNIMTNHVCTETNMRQ